MNRNFNWDAGYLKVLEVYLNGDKDLYDTECRIRRKDGTWVETVSHGKTVEYVEGRPVKLVGVNICIDKSTVIINSSIVKRYF